MTSNSSTTLPLIYTKRGGVESSEFVKNALNLLTAAICKQPHGKSETLFGNDPSRVSDRQGVIFCEIVGMEVHFFDMIEYGLIKKPRSKGSRLLCLLGDTLGEILLLIPSAPTLPRLFSSIDKFMLVRLLLPKGYFELSRLYSACRWSDLQRLVVYIRSPYRLVLLWS